MASWMVHLRIADKLLDAIPGLSPTEFVVGNIAPDSGVPNADWTSFTPSTTVSHYRRDSGGKVGKIIDIPAYIRQYFTPEQQNGYSARQYSFYLGYLVHLLTDIEWSDKIAVPSFQKFIRGEASARNPLVAKIKDDWYDLDYLYLRKHPDFRAFRIYRKAEGFVNEFMEEFSADAFDNRRAYITDFYLQENDHLDREYPYLTEADAEAFVENAAAQILQALPGYGVRTGNQENYRASCGHSNRADG